MNRPQAIALAEGYEHLDELADLPARLPTVPNQCQGAPTAGVEVLQTAIDHCRVVHGVEAAFDELFARPLIARPAQITHDLPQHRRVIARESSAQVLVPVSKIG